MNNILLRSGLIIFILLFLSIGLQAQQNRFIYIQTENRQPFYIQIDKKFLSSSASGHIIISKLIDSVYKIYFGFPKNEWPGQNVTISVKDTDAGFILKNFGERGWGLFNLQTAQVLRAEIKNNTKKIAETVTTGDEFARVLALVVNDPSIGQVTKIDYDSIPVNNSIAIETKTVESELVKPVLRDQSKPDTEMVRDEISKLMYDSTAEGINMFYLDKANEYIDTVKVFIPISKSVVFIESEKQIELLNQVKGEKTKKDPRFIDMELPNPNLQADSGLKKTDDIVITEKRSGDKKRNANCKKTATHNDFLKLRKQMAGEENENNMMKAANKQFITLCFTTEQIKNLGTLFIKEDERYKFYVGAFRFVSDAHNYASLQDQLTDNYYISRFKAMLSQ